MISDHLTSYIYEQQAIFKGHISLERVPEVINKQKMCETSF